MVRKITKKTRGGCILFLFSWLIISKILITHSRTKKWVEGEPLAVIRARSRKGHGALPKMWGSSILFRRMGIAIGARSLNKPVRTCIQKLTFSRVLLRLYIENSSLYDLGWKKRGEESTRNGQKIMFCWLISSFSQLS